MKQLTRSRFRGFTLIELLVVILILAILAALIVPKLIGRAEDAKRVKAAADLSTLSGMLNSFRLDTGRYPTTEEGLEALIVQPSEIQNWKGYTDKLSPDPWQEPYVYEFLGDDKFVITSYAADKAPGGDGGGLDISTADESQQ